MDLVERLDTNVQRPRSASSLATCDGFVSSSTQLGAPSSRPARTTSASSISISSITTGLFHKERVSTRISARPILAICCVPTHSGLANRTSVATTVVCRARSTEKSPSIANSRPVASVIQSSSCGLNTPNSAVHNQAAVATNSVKKPSVIQKRMRRMLPL
jgi:hypothetical protein